MADNFFGSLCLSDIPKELITTAANGKKYINIVVNKRREVSAYGHTHYVKAYVKKGEPAPEGKLFFGELKPSSFDDNQQQGVQQPAQQAPAPAQQQPDGDLPF